MFRDHIERGMALLDSRYPGWSMHINLDRLDMCVPSFPAFMLDSTDNHCGCILGQLGVLIPDGSYERTLGDRTRWGNYSNMLDLVFGFERARLMLTDDVSEYGFTLSNHDTLYSAERWPILTQEWREAIQARRIHISG